MNPDFLEQTYFGNTVQTYLTVAVILILIVLLKKYISRIVTAIFGLILKKLAPKYRDEPLAPLLQRPSEGLVVTILAYLAFLQIDQSLAKIVVWSRPAKVAGHDIPAKALSLVDVLDYLFLFFLLFFLTYLVSRIIDFIFRIRLFRARTDDDRQRQQLLPLLRDVIKVVVWTLGLMSILGAVFSVNVAALVAGMGIGGIAIAFAAKESLENLLASFMVMIDKPFTIGDWIKLDGAEGTIEKVGFRSTQIRSFDKSVIIVPNRRLIDSNLENFSERGTRRVLFTIGAVYGLSQPTLRQIMDEIKRLIPQVPGTVSDPIVYLDGFGASSVNIMVIYYMEVSPEVDYGEVKEAVNLGVYEIMYRLGDGFAFPTQVDIRGDARNPLEPPADKDSGKGAA